MKALLAILNSRKVQVAVIAVVGLILVKVFKIGEEQAGDIADKVFMLALAVIGGIAVEDTAAKLKNSADDLKKLK